MYSRKMLLSHMIGDSGNTITFSAILWLRHENILQSLGSTSLIHLHLQCGLRTLKIETRQTTHKSQDNIFFIVITVQESVF